MEIKSKTIAHEVIELESDNGIAVSFIVKDKLNNFLFKVGTAFNKDSHSHYNAIDTLNKIALLIDQTITVNEGKMNIPIVKSKGEVMVVSQFTLMADTTGGNRPGFSDAAAPDYAERLYEFFNEQLESMKIPVKKGEFGADMKVALVNDGPVTILLESK